MLLTKDGVYALADFTIHAAPEYDETGARAEGNDGVVLTCRHPQPHDKPWRKQWPAHVAAPTLRDLAIVAGQHWEREHQDATAESTEAGATK